MLKTKYGLTADDPYYYTVYERTVPLSGNLAAAWGDGPVEEVRTCPAEHQALKPAHMG